MTHENNENGSTIQNIELNSEIMHKSLKSGVNVYKRKNAKSKVVHYCIPKEQYIINVYFINQFTLIHYINIYIIYMYKFCLQLKLTQLVVQQQYGSHDSEPEAPEFKGHHLVWYKFLVAHYQLMTAHLPCSWTATDYEPYSRV